MFLIDLKKLCSDSHIISKEKGWLDTERTFAGMTDLMHSELAEALEDYRNNRPLGEIYFEYKDKKTKEPMSGYPESFVKEQVASGAWDAKPCGIPIEFADFAIRIAQHCGTEGWDLPGVIDYKNSLTRKLAWGDFEEAVAWAHVFISRAFLASKGSHLLGVAGISAGSAENPALDELANAYIVIEDFCRYPIGPGTPRIDLPKAIELKQAYNQTRPHRHGGKKI